MWAIRGVAGPRLATRAPRRIVVLLDASASMDARDAAGRRRIDLAKVAAARVGRAARPGDALAIFRVSARAMPLAPWELAAVEPDDSGEDLAAAAALADTFLAQGAPDGGTHDLGSLATPLCPRSSSRLASEAVEGLRIVALVEEPADVGLEIPEGVGLVEPDEDELGWGERGLDGRQPSFGRHAPRSENAGSAGSADRWTASRAAIRSARSPTSMSLAPVAAIWTRARLRAIEFSRANVSTATVSRRPPMS